MGENIMGIFNSELFRRKMKETRKNRDKYRKNKKC